METMNTIDDCRVVQLPRIVARQGSISPVTANRDIPFSLERVYFIYDVPGGAARGGHAHVELQQMIVSAMGCFDVVVDDGQKKKRYTLNRGYEGLYIPRLIWRELDNFSTGGICLVLASQKYFESDYIRNYNEFLKIKSSNIPL